MKPCFCGLITILFMTLLRPTLQMLAIRLLASRCARKCPILPQVQSSGKVRHRYPPVFPHGRCSRIA